MLLHWLLDLCSRSNWIQFSKEIYRADTIEWLTQQQQKYIREGEVTSAGVTDGEAKILLGFLRENAFDSIRTCRAVRMRIDKIQSSDWVAYPSSLPNGQVCSQIFLLVLQSSLVEIFAGRLFYEHQKNIPPVTHKKIAVWVYCHKFNAAALVSVFNPDSLRITTICGTTTTIMKCFF